MVSLRTALIGCACVRERYPLGALGTWADLDNTCRPYVFLILGPFVYGTALYNRSCQAVLLGSYLMGHNESCTLR